MEAFHEQSRQPGPMSATPPAPRAAPVGSDIPPGSLQVRLRAHGRPGVGCAVVRGTADLDTAPHLRRTLCDAVRTWPHGVVVDLAQIAFIDCAGLNALLTARRDAVTLDRHFTVRGRSPAVERLFRITDTADLFGPRLPWNV